MLKHVVYGMTRIELTQILDYAYLVPVGVAYLSTLKSWSCVGLG